MQLSKAETERAIWLQKKLKFLRWWNKCGVFLCRMKPGPANQEALWHEELQLLYNKKFQTPEPEVSFKRTFGDPLKRTTCNTVQDIPLADILTSIFGSKRKT